MVKLNKRIIISLFVLISVVLFQVQSVLAITELDTITFTAYHLGGSEDDMNYGGGSEWGRGALQLNGGIYGGSPGRSYGDQVFGKSGMSAILLY